MADRAVRIIVKGRVQGVGFRAFISREASRHTIRGWVRNRRDGSVEALLSGAQEEVDAVIAACRQGPRLARVTGIAEEPADDDGTVGFAERPTV
jgi:acylphosphatase